MVDAKAADQALQTYVRPQTFPVAIRMLRPGEPIPDRARRPARDFGKLSMNCQVIDMARRYGWMIALTRDDSICSLGITALGFDRPTHLYNSGTLCEGMYTATKEAGARSEAAVDKFEPGEYQALLVAPLDRATFEPDVVVVYANPAQVMRLTQAALWKSGGRLASSFQGRIVCADIIVTTMQTGLPQVILPCSGDRIFGQTQDHEMAFAIPWARMPRDHRGARGHAPGRHPLPDHAVHGVRGQAPPEVHGGEPPLGRGARQGRVHGPRPRGGRLQAELHRPRAGLPDRRVLRRHAGRALDRGVLHQPDQGRQGDAQLLRPLPAGRGARLQRPRQGGGGHGLRRQVLGLRRPVHRDPRPPGGQGRARAPGDPRSAEGRRGCRGSSSSAKGWSRRSSRRPSAPSRSGRGPSRCSCGTPR